MRPHFIKCLCQADAWHTDASAFHEVIISSLKNAPAFFKVLMPSGRSAYRSEHTKYILFRHIFDHAAVFEVNYKSILNNRVHNWNDDATQIFDKGRRIMNMNEV